MKAPPPKEMPPADLPASDWQEKAKKLLKANLTNLAKKVISGETLTAAEVNILKEEAGGDASTPESAPAPEFAKNQSRLADILGVSRKTITRYSKRQDAPSPRPNGSLSVAEWRAFLSKHDVLEDESDLDHAALKAKQILLQNRLLEQKYDTNAERLIPVEAVETGVAAIIATAKTVLLQGPSSLAPQVVGVSIPEAEKLLREWLHDALAKLHANPLGRKGAPNA
jgi:hypothetical protein